MSPTIDEIAVRLNVDARELRAGLEAAANAARHVEHVFRSLGVSFDPRAHRQYAHHARHAGRPRSRTRPGRTRNATRRRRRR